MRIFLKQLFASKLKITISALGIIALVAFTGIMIFQMTKVEVAFAEDGEEQIIQTHAKTVAELLKELDITPREHDAISHQLNEKLANGMNIAFTTGKDITLTIDDHDQHYITTADTVGEFLQNEGLQLSAHDEVTFEESDEIVDGMHLNLAKAFQITINDGGKKKKVWTTTNQTYKQVLADNDITYKQDSDDKMNVKPNDHVKKGKNLSITRIDYVYKEKEIAEPFETVKKYDDSLSKGTEKVTQSGENGLTKVTYRVRKKNNKHTDQEVISENTLRQTKNRIVVIGTKEPTTTVAQMSNKSASASNKNAEKAQASTKKADTKPVAKRTLTMSASAYTANCGGCSGFTATGINLKANPNAKVVAVDPSVIPLGTKVWVEGYGVAIAGDTGGAIHGNRIDLHVASSSQAHAFGTRTVTVKILD